MNALKVTGIYAAKNERSWTRQTTKETVTELQISLFVQGFKEILDITVTNQQESLIGTQVTVGLTNVENGRTGKPKFTGEIILK